MIGSTRTLRVWAYPEPADLRAGFDGLSALVSKRLGRDPLSGHLFLFVNRSRTRAKVLVWERYDRNLWILDGVKKAAYPSL